MMSKMIPILQILDYRALSVFFIICAFFSLNDYSTGNLCYAGSKSAVQKKYHVLKESKIGRLEYKTKVISSYSAVGIASWYGPRFHGRKTASGERFNKYEYTAAHRSLPFNTIVKVTNLRNNKSINVRITDRGPFNRKIIDLSEAAAKKLCFHSFGTARVKIEIIINSNSGAMTKGHVFNMLIRV